MMDMILHSLLDMMLCCMPTMIDTGLGRMDKRGGPIGRGDMDPRKAGRISTWECICFIPFPAVFSASGFSYPDLSLS